MKIDTTSDSPSWSKVFDISDELRALSSILEQKYTTIDCELFVCLRCLPNDIERKSFCRYYAKEKLLTMDITMNEDEFIPFKKDIDGQRRIIGNAFFEFFKENIVKYKKKLPGLEPLVEELIQEVQLWCLNNKWLIN
ncbi:hypothetical protein [Flavobacterium sp. '19STA2R22 D10 B1']|uniref:hypothetical protein n=1 Tax=Flavobacterium aerium TaxID=3037261 RepID=UPI00278C3F4C|nr:hypothetical protein [Flavobacterium sp. '19STA2R22 D10 B1']